MRGYKGWTVCVCTDIMNLEGVCSLGRHCDSVTAGGALLLVLLLLGGRREPAGEAKRGSKLSAEKKRVR